MKALIHRFALLLLFMLGVLWQLPLQAAALQPEKTLEFVQNKKQWHPSVKFSAKLHGGDLYLLQDGFLFNFYDAGAVQEYRGHGHSHQEGHRPEPHAETIRAHAYAVTFLGARPNPVIKGSETTPGIRNYYLGNDPAKWASEVKGYRVVEYAEVYPEIDLKLYENEEQRLKYDFVVQPGGNPAQIRMQYKGMDRIWLEKGELHIQASEAKVRELKPYAYQVVRGKQVEVPCRFVLKDNVVTFELPKGYNKKLPLVIDPTLVYSSFSGSSADNWGFTATFDEQENIYSGGAVFNINFPTTTGAYQVAFQGAVDIGIQKFNPSLSGQASLVYATYLGGRQAEVPHSLIVNNAGELLILGTTSSDNYPVINGYDMSFNGGGRVTPLLGITYDRGSDLIISKLNSNGTALRASTYLGGIDNDGLLEFAGPLTRNYGDQFRGDITVDSADNVYIATSTRSSNFPKVNGAATLLYKGDNDAVVCKLSSNLATLLWSNIIGNTGTDAAFSIQLDRAGNVYISGGTTSTGFPGVTSGSFRAAYGGSVDGFVAKFSNDGQQLLAATYIGTSSYDQTYFLQLDAFSNVYVLGQTLGNYPVSPGVYFNTNGRQFIQKLSTDLTTGIFSTIFGSGSATVNISPTAFLVDNCERIFVCGWGGNTNTTQQIPNALGGNTHNMPVTADAFQRTTDGSDFYLMQLSQNATNLEYATFMGGNQRNEHVDGGTSRFDKRGFVYQSVCANCGGFQTGFPVTPTAFSPTNRSSNCNNAAFKFNFEVATAIAGDSQKVCLNGGPVALTGFSPAGGTWSGPGVSPQGVFTPSQALLGNQQLTYTVRVGSCVSTSVKNVQVVEPPVVQVQAPVSVFCLTGEGDTLTGIPAGGVFRGPGMIGNRFVPAVAGVGRHQIVYTYTSAEGCSTSDTVLLEVTPTPPVQAGPDTAVCFLDAPITLTATPEGGAWRGAGITAAGVFTPSRNLVGTQTLTYVVTENGCTVTDSVRIVVRDLPAANPVVAQSTCPGDSLIGLPPFEIKFSSGTNEKVDWNFGDGSASASANPVHTFTRPGRYEVKLTVAPESNCRTTTPVAVVTVLEPNFPNIITPNSDGLNDKLVLKFTCAPFGLKIFNRWGKTIFESNDYKQDWDAAGVSDGIYYYHIRTPEAGTVKGWFEVVR